MDDIIPLDQAQGNTANLPDVIPMDQIHKYVGPGAGDTSKTASAPQGEKSGWLQAIKLAALPTLGGIGGAALGGMAAGPSIAGVPLGVLTGEMAGAGLGEKANQWLGITEPSNLSVAASALSAPLGRAVGPAIKGAGSIVAKTLGGRAIMSDAAMGVLQAWLKPAVSSEELFAKADALKVMVPAEETYNTLKNMVSKESTERAPGEVNRQILKSIKPLKKWFTPETPAPIVTEAKREITPIVMGKSGIRGMESGATSAAKKIIEQPPTPKILKATDLMEEVQRLSESITAAYEGGNVKLARALNEVRSAMLNDLEKSGAGVVGEASGAYRREMALKDLSTLLTKPHPSFKVTEFMKTHPLFNKTFNSVEKEQILRIAKKLEAVAPSGSSGVGGRGLLGIFGYHLGGVPGEILGMLSGDMVRALMESPIGRNMTERMLASRSTLDHATAAKLAIIARGLMAQPPQPQQEQQ